MSLQAICPELTSLQPAGPVTASPESSRVNETRWYSFEGTHLAINCGPPLEGPEDDKVIMAQDAIKASLWRSKLFMLLRCQLSLTTC